MALLKPTTQKNTNTNKAATGMAVSTGYLRNGTQSSRIFSELIGCQTSAASATTVMSVCQKIFSRDEMPSRFFLTTLR